MTDYLLAQVRNQLAADYDIGRELGRGGMAVVYAAVHRPDGRPVAIKVLPPQMAFSATARGRFVREARLSAALQHPGIVPVYAAAMGGDFAWFAMALVQGESLARRIARGERFSIADARFILAEVADALGYAHAAGVVHRDIKPDNILLDSVSGRPMLTDFGIARALDDEARMTLDGVAIGTPAFMSPEQATGNTDVDGRADIYSLGVVGYQLLTGRLPFTALNTPALLAKHVSEQPVPIPELRADVPVEVVAAIDGALEKKPAARWPTASAFRTALGESPKSVGRLAPSPGLAPRTTPAQLPMRAAVVAHRIARFRRKAIASLALTCLLGGLNVIYAPDFLIFLLLAGLLALDLVIMGSELYAEDIPLGELFGGAREDDSGVAHRPSVPPPAYPSAARYDAAERDAARDHAEIRRMLTGLSESERALIPDVGATVDALHDRIRLFVTELRGLGPHVNVETDLTGSVQSRLDSAADAMHAVRLDLMSLRDGRFERGLDAFNETSDRARALSRQIDPA